MDAGLYIQEGLEDRRRQIVSLIACMNVYMYVCMFVCMYMYVYLYVCIMYVCMYVLMNYTLKLSVMAESGRSFELR